MAKELTHRADELKQLGWSEQDVLRYAELWDYRQRWGAMNLERDDRQFLRKAESALPEQKPLKASMKKNLKDKSYYCRLLFLLNEMSKAEQSFALSAGAKGLWPILLEEELRTLDYFEPVLGLPDTLKAKALIPFREQMVSSLVEEYKKDIQTHDFDFDTALLAYNESNKKSWQPLRDGVVDREKFYPVIPEKFILAAHKTVRKAIVPLIRNTFPSLVDTEKSNPSEEWIPESES